MSGLSVLKMETVKFKRSQSQPVSPSNIASTERIPRVLAFYLRLLRAFWVFLPICCWA
jgi:hypothetical protein